MALSATEITDLARLLGRRIFDDTGAFGHTDVPGLKAAIAAIDTAMDATTNQAVAAFPATPIKSALLQFIQADAPNLSTQEAGVALALWALHAVGLG